jgi:serine/threonine protein kinase
MKRDDIIKQALMLETQDRTVFLESIKDEKLKSEVAFIINDDEELTSFILHTAAADVAMEQVRFDNLKPGQTVNRITIKSLIGKGGMGHVYLGYDETLQRNVAIKSIRPEFLTHPSTQQRFVQEAQILSQINHPSICQIYDYIESKSGNLLVLEWIDGVTLNHQAIDAKDVLSILTDLASALAAAHEKGIIHRDLKPENIMITQQGQIKVLDFGIAQSVTENSKDHSPIGTLRYMSPEQANGEPVTLFSDIYAFGLIMSELLSKQPCYQFHDTDSLRDAVTKAQVQLPSDIKKSRLKIIAQCLVKTPEERPTAQILVAQLHQLQNRSYARWVTVSLLLSLLVVSLLGIHFWQQNQVQTVFTDLSERIDVMKDRLAQTESLPAHDTTAKMAAMQNSAQNILSDIENSEKLDALAKNHLKGKLHFHNRNYSAAVSALKLAYAQDNNNSDIAALYAQALSQEYFVVLSQNIEDTELAQQQNPQLKNASEALKNRLQQIEVKHPFKNNQALPLLAASQNILEQKYDEAVSAIIQPEIYQEGQYGPLYLAGIIKRQQGLRAFYQGDYAAALTHYEEALRYFKSSNDFARSYIGNYHEFCYLSSELLKTHQHHSPEVTEAYHQAINLCEQGLLVEPENQFIMGQLATINWRYGQWLLTHGQSPDEYFQQSLSWGQRSLDVADNAQAWENQGIVYDLIALQKIEKGQNPYHELDLALAAYDKVNQLNPAQITRTTGNQLYALNIKSQYQLLVGDDVAETGSAAFNLIQKAQQHPDYQLAQAGNIYNNFAYIALLAAYSDFNLERDHLVWLEKSKQFYKGIETELGNKSQFGLSGLAEAYWFQAEVASANNLPFTAELKQASQYIDEALELSRQYYWMPLTKAKTVLLKVKSQRSDDVDQDMTEAKNLLDESLTLNNQYLDTHVVMGYWHALKLMSSKEASKQMQHFQNGIDSCEQAIKVNSRAAEPWLLKAALYQMALAQGLSVTQNEQDHQAWLDQAYKLNPHAKILLITQN